MALGNLVPQPDDPTQGTMPPLLDNLRQPLGQEPKSFPALEGGLPPLTQQAVQTGQLRPLVTNPLQQSIDYYQNKLMPHPSEPGFWHKLGHVLNTVRNVAEQALTPNIALADPTNPLNWQANLASEEKQMGEAKKEAGDELESGSRMRLQEAQAGKAEAEADKARNVPDRTENPQQGYADAIKDAISRGVDPATDPHVLAWKQAIGDIQKPEKEPKEESPTIELQRQLQTMQPGTPEYKAVQQRIKDLNPQAEQRFNFQVGEAGKKDAKAADANTEKEYVWTRNNFDKDLHTYRAQAEKLQEAATLVGNGAMGDAIGSIKSLSGLASGQGSGVRITQAELNSIAHARGYAGDFQAWLQKFGDGRSLTPAQEAELRAVVGDIEKKSALKERVINKVLDDLGGATDTKTIRTIYSQARHALMGGEQ